MKMNNLIISNNIDVIKVFTAITLGTILLCALSASVIILPIMAVDWVFP